MASTLVLALATCVATAACAQVLPPAPGAAARPFAQGMSAERVAAMAAANKALSAENQPPTSFKLVVSLTDPDVVAQAQALSDKAGHGGLHYQYFLFRSAIDKVRHTHADKLDIPVSTYRIYQPVDLRPGVGLVDLVNLSHVVVDGHGSTLLFYSYGKAIAPLTAGRTHAAIRLTGSDHLVLRDLVIDWDEPLAVPATVSGTGQPGSSQTLTVDPAFRIDPGSPIPITLVDPFDVRRRSFGLSRDMSAADFAAWNAEQERGGSLGYLCPTAASGVSPAACFRYVGGQTYAFGAGERLFPVPPSAGNFLATARDNNYGAIIVDGGASFIDIDGVAIYSSPGSAIGLIGAGPAVRIAHCHITRKPDALLRPGEQRRFISTLSDGMDVITSAGDVVIEDNEIGYQGDDGLNIRSDVRAATATAAYTLSAVPAWGGASYYRVGGLVDIYDAKARNLVASGVPIIASSPSTQNPGQMQLVLAQTMPALQTGQAYRISPRDWGSARVIVRNNWFHDNSERGVVVHGNAVAVVDNRFDRTAESAIQLLYDNQSGHPEGPVVSDVVISGNAIHDVNVHWFDPAARFVAPPAAIAVYMATRSGFGANDAFAGGNAVPRHIAITDNVIDAAPGVGILVSQADDVIMARNRVTQSGQHRYGLSATDGKAILVEQTTGLRATANVADAPIVMPNR
jgi:hypothetical protein